jgi:hypothetical protein
LLGGGHAVLPFPHVVNLFSYKFSSLGAGRLSFPRVFPSSLQRLFFWHSKLLKLPWIHFLTAGSSHDLMCHSFPQMPAHRMGFPLLIPRIKACRGNSMIRKLKTGQYRLYSRKKNSKTGRRRNLGTFATRKAAEAHERAVQYFKR